MDYEDVTTTAKKIRKELKTKFPGQKFSVRSDNYSLGSSVNVQWTNGVSLDSVEAVLKKYEDVDYCQVTGEILGGGNRFVFAHRDITKDVRDKVEKELLEEYVSGTFGDNPQYDNNFSSAVWQKLRSTDYEVIA